MSFSSISGAGGVWHWSGTGSGKTGDLFSFSVWCGSSLLQVGTGDDSGVERSWRRFLRKPLPSTSTSYERRPRRREHRPKLHFCSPGSFTRITSPTFKGTRFLVPRLYCLHCCLFRAAKLLTVVFSHCLAGVSFQQWAARCGCADPSAFELVRH